jgi:hypothetical protein
MTNEELRILRAAMLAYEETMNEVVTGYLDGSCISDGGEELVSLISRAIEARYQKLCAGEADQLLATWRHRATVN